MTDTWFWKLVVSIAGAIGLWWIQLPVAVSCLATLIFADVLLGGIYHWVRPERVFSKQKLLIGFFVKVSLVSLMGWAAFAFRGPLREVGIEIDPLKYFLNVANLFEFLGCIQNYVRAGGPGANEIDAFGNRIKSAMLQRLQGPIDQETASARIEQARQAGQSGRA